MLQNTNYRSLLWKKGEANITQGHQICRAPDYLGLPTRNASWSHQEAQDFFIKHLSLHFHQFDLSLNHPKRDVCTFFVLPDVKTLMWRQKESRISAVRARVSDKTCFDTKLTRKSSIILKMGVCHEAVWDGLWLLHHTARHRSKVIPNNNFGSYSHTRSQIVLMLISIVRRGGG